MHEPREQRYAKSSSGQNMKSANFVARARNFRIFDIYSDSDFLARAIVVANQFNDAETLVISRLRFITRKLKEEEVRGFFRGRNNRFFN